MAMEQSSPTATHKEGDLVKRSPERVLNLSSRTAAAGAVQATPIMMEGIKPHYMCTKAECIQELRSHQIEPNKDLTLPEMRTLLKEARREAGLLSSTSQDKDVMGEIKNANAVKLRTMASERRIDFNAKTTVGEFRMLLRAHVVQSGTNETVVDFGKHKGMTYAEVAETFPSYLTWAKEEVLRASDPHWQLLQLAAWAKKRESGKDDEEEMPPAGESRSALLSKLSKNKVAWSTPSVASASADPGSPCLDHHSAAFLQKENSELKAAMEALNQRLQELELQVHKQSEGGDKRSRS